MSTGRLSKYFADRNPDYIIHCAAYGNMYEQENELECIKANVNNLANMLFSSHHIHYKAFINFSTSSVGLPYETMYSATKASGEKIVKAYVNKHNKPVCSVRPFTVVGPGEQKEHLIPTLIRRAILKEPVFFVKDPVHDFIHIKDLCRAIQIILDKIDKAQGKTIDIGRGVSVKNEYIKTLVEQYTEKTIKTNEVQSMRPYDNLNWKADTTVLKSFGWVPEYDVTEIIREMVEYYEKTF